MAKRKPQDEFIVVDVDSPMSEVFARISKHRSCWKHMVTSLYTHGKKIKKKEAEKLRRFDLISQCFLGTFPTRQRSRRRIKHKFAITRVIKEKEKKRLDSGEFDCYFQNLWKSFSKEKRTSFVYLDSLWFYWYLKASWKGKVLTWIKRKQIFSKKYVLVPIVCWGHWSLLIFCHLGEVSESNDRTPCMLLLDSLEMANPRRLEPDIRKFVLDIYTSEGRPEDKKLISQIPLLVPKVPQQRNGEECGNYVLYFINLFMLGAPDDFSIKDYPYFMNKNWFSPECLERFSEELESFGK
ncbi:probable ubiquitin-like-specific protease 2A [Ricinus communis]|uniref:Sentrin/sumo-specific protease, putative n=1 Tax=Ricinus communis TaxID=3988 RepID=B9RAM6_RICCO|nr:probable ubiquitin-like-specific protease 2A [Ricinus communis]EEF51853.1 sentrin/sumo-specific protease, putative [Ricinus communis]|eukprot:XP_002511251.1 probable ubiquitin-like-specific protease 2A [Ricinus communis]